MRLPELLAPAGSREAFLGALSAGADAVYLGGMKFGARAYAANFSEQEIAESLREAHILGRKIYLTLNVLTRESEMEETLSFAERMADAGLDGVIVQDLGVAAALHRRCPALPVHASTQMSVTSAESVRLLKQLGVVRVVPARELSLAEISAMKREEPIEIETFIHGAMCYSYSGRCLFSSFLGGRSGNRGRCAGTCRLPFDVYDERGALAGGSGAGTDRAKDCYPLSMRDMNVLAVLPDLIDAGIDSFKIEGRMKSPEYAAGVTALYRKYLDRFADWDAAGRKTPWKVEREDQKALESLYLRTSLSTGYYYKRNGRELLTIDRPGYAGTDDKLLKKIEETYLRGLPKRDVDAHAVFRAGEPAVLTLQAGPADGDCVTVKGDVVQKADRRPLSEEEIAQRLRKTGDSMIRIDALTVDTDGRGFMPVSAVNALRRKAVGEMETLLAARGAARPANAARNADPEGKGDADSRRAKAPEIWAAVSTPEQLTAALGCGPEHIIAEAEPELIDAVRRMGNEGRTDLYLALPHVFRREDRERAADILRRCEDLHAAGVIARTPEELQFVREAGYRGRVISDSFIYEWNCEARDLLSRYADRMVLPLELSAADLAVITRGARDRQLLTVYGRLPMMISAGCVMKTMGQCRHDGSFYAQIGDRKGKRFPVRCVCSGCYNVILNSLPLSLHKFAEQGDPFLFEVGGWIAAFTDEDGEETGKILGAFQGLALKKGGNLFTGETGTYTTGHYRKSAL